MQHTSVHLPDIDATSLNNYKELLFKIAMSFGLTAKQSTDTINEIYLKLERERFNSMSITFSIKVYLSKLMVSKCIFRISNELFGRGDNRDVSILNQGACYTSINLTSIKLKKVPLSCKVAFVLNALSEFTEEEIAEVLNISSMKVKERIKKAYSYIL